MKFARIAALFVLVLSGSSFAELKKQTIEYKHGDVNLKGYLVYDDTSKEKRPGVLVAPEWWGLNDYPKHRAEQLAEMGYIAFAIDMYGDGKSTKDPKQAGEWAGAVKGNPALMRERAAAGLEILRKQEMTDPAKIVGIGYCFGGATVLELARSGADILGVVSFHGALDTTEPAEAGAIKAKILAQTGADDPFVPADQVKAFEDEMRKSGADWQMISYGGAVHAFTNPDVDAYKLAGAAYNEKADKRSWAAMKTFFSEVFSISAEK